MGVTVRQKKEGKGKPWWVFISHNGRRTSRRVGDKKAAEEVASKIRARLELGEYPDKTEPKKTTFRDYAEDWMRIIIPVTCKASTLTDYRYLLDNHILPAMGEMDIRQIGRGEKSIPKADRDSQEWEEPASGYVIEADPSSYGPEEAGQKKYRPSIQPG